MENIADIISKGESTTIEFKKEIPANAKRFLNTVVAFSNTKGGNIIFGVDDTRKVLGVEGDPYKLMDSIVDSVTTGCTPAIYPEPYVSSVDGKNLIILEVPAGTNRPYYLTSTGKENGTYVRVGASSRLADEERLMELSLEGKRRSYDEVPLLQDQVDENNPNVKKLYTRLSEIWKRQASLNDLENLGLIFNENGKHFPTRALTLMSDNPYYFARIQCARFKGTTKSEIIDRKEYGGPINEQVGCALNFILNHINYGCRIDGICHQDSYEIPPEALREAITNAVVHRSYTIEGSPISVAVYDDRISVVSPGSIPSTLTLEQAREGRSVARNRSISRVFKELGLSEGWGSGLRRMSDSCLKAGLKEPTIIDDGSFVEVIFHRNRMKELKSSLTEKETEFLCVVKRNPSLTIKAVSGTIGVSEATGNRIVKSLREKKILSRDGSRKTGEWVTNWTY